MQTPNTGWPSVNGREDLNQVTLTGFSLSAPEVGIALSGTMSVAILLATRGPLRSDHGTVGQQTYLIDVWADGLVAEQLLTIPEGTQLLLHGSLDYVYRQDSAQWTIGVRVHQVEVVHGQHVGSDTER